MFTCHPIHHHLILLTNPMCPIHCLHIHLWVEIGIIYDHSICSSQIDAQSTCPSGEQEYIFSAVLLGEFSNLIIPQLYFSFPINSTVFILPEIAIIFQDIQHHSEL